MKHCRDSSPSSSSPYDNSSDLLSKDHRLLTALPRDVFAMIVGLNLQTEPLWICRKTMWSLQLICKATYEALNAKCFHFLWLSCLNMGPRPIVDDHLPWLRACGHYIGDEEHRRCRSCLRLSVKDIIRLVAHQRMMERLQSWTFYPEDSFVKEDEGSTKQWFGIVRQHHTFQVMSQIVSTEVLMELRNSGELLEAQSARSPLVVVAQLVDAYHLQKDEEQTLSWFSLDRRESSDSLQVGRPQVGRRRVSLSPYTKRRGRRDNVIPDDGDEEEEDDDEVSRIIEIQLERECARREKLGAHGLQRLFGRFLKSKRDIEMEEHADEWGSHYNYDEFNDGGDEMRVYWKGVQRASSKSTLLLRKPGPWWRSEFVVGRQLRDGSMVGFLITYRNDRVVDHDAPHWFGMLDFARHAKKMMKK